MAREKAVEMLAPELSKFGFQKRDWMGRPKGEKFTYKWKLRPYRHQVDAVKKLLHTGFGGALLMEPRTGKTKVAIDYASIQYQLGRVKRVLVVAPVSVLGVWQDQIEQNCPWKHQVVVWDKDGRKETTLPAMGTATLDFVLINYDAFSTPGTMRTVHHRNGTTSRQRGRTGGRFAVRKKLESWQPDLIILDESHRIKSPSARKTTMLIAMGAKVPYRVIMTGTLVTKKKRIFDVYAQWEFLNPHRFANYTFSDFKKWVGVWVDVGYPRWIKNRDDSVTKLRREIHRDAFSITRAECYDLPERLPPVVIKVPLEESAKVYDDMANDMVAKIHTGEIAEASIPIVVRLRLAQITSGIVKTTNADGSAGRLVRIGQEKLRILEDVLYDQMELDEKVVVCARFRPDLAAIAKLGAKLKVPVLELHGGVDRRTRDLNIKKFREHDGAALFAMQPNAGAMGIDLSTASTMIWYSLTSSYVDFTQSEDRIALSNTATRFIYLLGEETVDELDYEGLREDADVSKMISRRPESILRGGD